LQYASVGREVAPGCWLADQEDERDRGQQQREVDEEGAADAAAHALLAMQKVVGSNPISRSREGLHLQAFFFFCCCFRRGRSYVRVVVSHTRSSRSDN
jgi:hypothetical protein